MAPSLGCCSPRGQKLVRGWDRFANTQKTKIIRWKTFANRYTWLAQPPAKMTKSLLVGLDTSVVLRLLTGEPENQSRTAVVALDEIVTRGGKAAVSDLVVSETYYALQYHYGVPKAEALETLKAFLLSDEIHSLGSAAKILR